MAQIRPAKVIKGSIVTVVERDIWTEDDGTGVIYYPYTWDITCNITSQLHFNSFTPTSNEWNGLDITVGMWICWEKGKAWKVIEIDHDNTSINTIKCVVEDVDRYNLVTDPDMSGSGMIASYSNIFFFEMGNEGLPILSPIQPGVLTTEFVTDVMCRFIGRNPSKEYVPVHQIGHTFNVGDIVKPDSNNPGQYVLATADMDVDKIVGIVTEVNIPGVEFFTYRPFGVIVNNINPGLVGNPGDFFYLDPNSPGKYTSVKPSTYIKPIWMRLDSPNRGVLLQRQREDLASVRRFDVSVSDNQIIFVLPTNTQEVLSMTINGIENTDYTFDLETHTLTYQATHYGVEATDEVFFMYKS